MQSRQGSCRNRLMPTGRKQVVTFPVPPNRLAAAAAGMLLTVMLGVGVARAYSDRWTATGTYTDIVAADCGDCEENTGIVVACTGNGQPARITVNAAASETDRDGAFAPVVFLVDGERFVRDAKTVEYGMIGFTPEFLAAYDDPLIPALQRGKRATVTFNGQQAEIGLKGSRDALDIFKAHCGWTPEGYRQNLERTANAAPAAQPDQPPPSGQQQTGLPPYSQTVLTRTPVKADANGMFWFTGDGFGGGSPKTIRYAIPETDAVAIHATCEQYDPANLSVEVFTSFGNRAAGSAVTLEIAHAQGVSRFDGTVFIDNEEYAGSRYTMPKSDGVWQSIAGSAEIKLGVKGETMAALPGSAGRAALLEFSNLCRQ